ncbi:gamma-glutamyltransferase [Mariprofundus sp. KV]|uniref:gamma-glutamyltransferase n=1 Tax=Mariprofundus sp. KV TaxID=2608715 RepID=UPI00159F8FD6|nr:gamma-glutamyltransferase [Mariprofundus sp. KV]NWF36658.1 gamma-glutamyltransferase [Mariprofundus sp. KV]
MRSVRTLLTFAFLLLLTSSALSAEAGMVVAAQKSAAEAGVEMLKKGGNAFDAAAATALALGVVEPGSSGIGGGGFFLLYIAKEKRYVMLDARETSPGLAGKGEVYATQSSVDGPQSAGVPGLAAGVDHLVSRYGKLSRKAITRPAIDLARDGFEVGPRLRSMLNWRGKVFNETGRNIFISGQQIKQEALADTLARFAKGGSEEFYRGETAGRLIADMKRDGGLIREADMAAYRVIERTPVTFDYKNYRVISAPLPSSGGMTLAHVFGQLKNDDLKAMERTDRVHLLVEAMKRAYLDRNAHMGDSDFVDIPDLLNADRLQQLRVGIRMDRATPSSELGSTTDAIGPGTDTTHFSVIDSEGNMVSATLSINYAFGSGYVSPSTGILMNDEMDDFATRPGKPNAYGLVQSSANAVAPGKRMLSSMTPTFVIGPDRTFIVGTPGGSRIISMVLLASLGFMLDESAPADWVNAPRYHHQFLPDVIQHEQGAFTAELTSELQSRGHIFKPMNRQYGNMHAIVLDRKSGQLTGLTDARGEGVSITEK